MQYTVSIAVSNETVINVVEGRTDAMHKLRKLMSMLWVIPFALISTQASAVVSTQLGFALDGSGSINSTEFATQRTGLANAFGALPTDGSVEITVVQFSGSAGVEISPTVISSVADRNNLVTAVNGISQFGGSTVPGTAIDLLTTQMTGSASFAGGSVDSLINLSTDGGFSLSPAVTSATNAKAAGIDALTAEAIGPDADTDNLLDMVFNPANAPGVNSVLLATDASPPNPLTNPAWVVPVSDFAAFGPVVDAKIQAIVTPTPTIPEPESLGLLAIGLLALGLTGTLRQRKNQHDGMMAAAA